MKTKRKGGLVPERDVLDLVFFGAVVLVRLAHFSGGHLFGQGPFRARTFSRAYVRSPSLEGGRKQNSSCCNLLR